jgi:ribonuclease I
MSAHTVQQRAIEHDRPVRATTKLTITGDARSSYAFAVEWSVRGCRQWQAQSRHAQTEPQCPENLRTIHTREAGWIWGGGEGARACTGDRLAAAAAPAGRHECGGR